MAGGGLAGRQNRQIPPSAKELLLAIPIRQIFAHIFLLHRIRIRRTNGFNRNMDIKAERTPVSDKALFIKLSWDERRKDGGTAMKNGV